MNAKIETSSNDGKLMFIVGVSFGIILFILSFIFTNYSIPFRYVCYGFVLLLGSSGIIFHQKLNYSLTIENGFIEYKSPFIKRQIELSKLKAVKRTNKNKIDGLILRLYLVNSPDIKLNTYYVKKKEIKDFIEKVSKIIAHHKDK